MDILDVIHQTVEPEPYIIHQIEIKLLLRYGTVWYRTGTSKVRYRSQEFDDFHSVLRTGTCKYMSRLFVAIIEYPNLDRQHEIRPFFGLEFIFIDSHSHQNH